MPVDLVALPASITGPSATWPVTGSPTGSWSARAASAATYVVGDATGTRCRPAVMQTWPWCANEPQAPTDDAASDVHVVEHEQRGVAAELEVHPLEVLPGQRRRPPGRPWSSR